MLELFIEKYYKFFDETLESTTFVVLIITLIVFVVGTFIPMTHADMNYLKSNILESELSSSHTNTVNIGGEMYRINFQKIK